MNPVRVLIVDPRPIVRRGLTAVLAEAAGAWEVCGMAENGAEAVSAAASLHPDLVIMDDQLPKLSGLAAMAEMRRSAPGLAILFYSNGLSARALLEAYHSAANGCLLKSEPLEVLLLALEAVRRGHRFRSARVAALCGEIEQTRAAHEPLTPREVETLREIVAGLSSKQIAAKLGLSVKTIDTHRTHLLRKLGLHSTAELVSYAWRAGLVDG